jgi:serine/threonine-protein kinase RIO1
VPVQCLSVEQTVHVFTWLCKRQQLIILFLYIIDRWLSNVVWSCNHTILEKRKSNDECISILVIYWEKTGLLHTKISNRNIIYWKETGLLHTKISNHNIIYWKETGLLHTKISNDNIIYWKETGLLHTKISNHNIIYSS